MEVSGTIMEYIPLIWCCVDYGFCEMCKKNRLLYLFLWNCEKKRTMFNRGKGYELRYSYFDRDRCRNKIVVAEM